MPKLICLMPTFNKEETLAKAIESVMMQKTDFDYKLIILDDCSTDNSNRIAQKYKEKYPEKIDIVRNKTNLKLLRSIMNGYALLKGADYFCVLDADDWYVYDKKFAEAVAFLDTHKKFSMYMTNIIVKKGDQEEPCYKGNYKIIDFNFTDRKYDNYILMQTSGFVYRNVYFKDGMNEKFAGVLNSKFPESYRADGFRFEWYLQAGKVHFENKVTAVYNYDMNGIWSSMSEAEQILHNAKMFYSCAVFITSAEKFYMQKARQLYIKAMQAAADMSDETFVKNKKLITDLATLLFENKSSFLKKTAAFCIKLIHNKKLKNLFTRD